ncbi:MAG: TIGR01244 family sulfur transferase [Hyphomicrobium sp.]|jgi:sulfide:quinone oxidoreductase
MTRIVPITPDFAVAGALTPQEMEAIAAAGFRTVINNRPDGEEFGQATAEACGEAARRFGLLYYHLPAAGRDELMSEALVKATLAAIAASPGPILAHCRSGYRSTVIWAAAAAQAGACSVAEVAARAAAAGVDVAPFAGELERLAALASQSQG